MEILDASHELLAAVEKVIEENPKAANSLQWVRLLYQTSHSVFEKYQVIRNTFEQSVTHLTNQGQAARAEELELKNHLDMRRYEDSLKHSSAHQ